MPKFGGFNEDDLTNLERATDTIEDGNGRVLAHSILSPGMRYGGRDETRQHQVVTRIDHLEHRVLEHIRENLIPRVAEHSRISIKTDPVRFLYYQELKFGRRCSCWNTVDSVADKRCPVCYGTGFVTGYNKYGTKWHSIDATTENLTLVNVIPDYESQLRPVPLSLLDVPKGHIEATIQLGPNIGVLDLLRLGAHAPSGSSVTPLIRLSTESSFVPLSKDSVESRLVDNNGLPSTIVLRIVLTRTNSDAGLPSVTYMHLRYRNLKNITIVADIPSREESIELQEYGLLDVFDTIDMVISRQLTNIRTSDFFIRVKDAERFKVVRRNQWNPEELLIETSVRARHINKDESTFLVP